MAVPNITETRCRDGSVQAGQVIKDYTSNPIPTSLNFSVSSAMRILGTSMPCGKKKKSMVIYF